MKGEPAARQLAGQSDDRRGGQEPDVGLLIEATLREHGLIEESEPRRDEAEQRRGAGEYPECRRAKRRRERQPVIGAANRINPSAIWAQAVRQP